MRGLSLLAATLVAALALPSAGLAASEQDRSFLSSALPETIDLRSLADLAASKSHDARVRAFAREISHNAGAQNRALASFAEREGVKQPGTLSIRATDQYSRISAQSG